LQLLRLRQWSTISVRERTSNAGFVERLLRSLCSPCSKELLALGVVLNRCLQQFLQPVLTTLQLLLLVLSERYASRSARAVAAPRLAKSTSEICSSGERSWWK
jgi:hypothetical protein